jgi:hypothetical protein
MRSGEHSSDAATVVCIGRDEVINALDELVLARTKWILVEGVPGTGKTQLLQFYRSRLQRVGFELRILERLHVREARHDRAESLAELLYTHREGIGRRVIPYHAMDLSVPDSVVPFNVVRSLARQVETALPEARDPNSERSELRLSEALRRSSPILAQQKKQLVVMLDGVDQFEGDFLADQLSRIVPMVPDSVTIICSSRPMHGVFDYMQSSGSFAHVSLDKQEANESVCRALVEQFPAELSRALDLERAIAVSERNPRYLGLLLDQLREQPRSSLESVPYRFREHLERLWDSLERIPAAERDIVKQGLGIVCNTQDPIPLAEIAAIAGWTSDDASEPAIFMRGARPFLLAENGPLGDLVFRPFHPAFAELVLTKLQRELSAKYSVAAVAAAPSLSIPVSPIIAGPAAVAYAVGAGAVEATSPSPVIEPSPRVEPAPMETVPAPAARPAPSVPSTEPAPLPFVETGEVKTRWALLIGVDGYVEPGLNLQFCVDDVMQLAGALDPLGYNISLMHDRQAREQQPTLFNIRDALLKLNGRCDPDDLLWVHFSCHGTIVNGKQYLLASDSRQSDAQSMLAIDTVCDFMRASGARRYFLTLDACHAGIKLDRDGGAPADASDQAQFVRFANELAEGFYLLAASTSSESAQDDVERKHGAFTQFLIEALQGEADRTKRGFVTADDLRDYVVFKTRQWVFAKGMKAQMPNVQANVTGAFIVADRRTKAG